MNNEEKIISMLEKLNTTVEKHDTMFEKINSTLEKHSTMLEKHGAMLEKLNTTVEKHDQMLNEMQETITRVALTQENVVLPQLKLLVEGHNTLLETLAPKDRVEALEDDVAFMKSVINAMGQEIAELKASQG